MRSATRLSTRSALWAGCLLVVAGGCHEAVRPVRVGVTKIDLIGPRLLPRWEPLRIDLGLYLGLEQLVQFEVLTPRQVRVHLASGRAAFALVEANEYAEIARGGNDVVLAAAVNTSGKTERVGLIITRADSPIEAVPDIKGKRFDFGPKGDPLLDTAAVCALWRAGVTLGDIEKDKLLGYHHHINSREVAKAVVYAKVPAGIIDAADYERWPKTGGSVLLGTISQDQMRILHRTDPVPEMVVLASKNADPALVAKVKKYFLEDVNKKKLAVLGWLGVDGFVPATREQYAPFVKLVNEVYPPASEPSEAEEIP